MHVTAKADYAVRAVIELAGSNQSSPRKVDEVAQAQGIPVSFLENILTQLRSSGIVRSQRGPEGGYWLAHPPEEVTLAQVIRAVEGPLVGVRGQRPEEVSYDGAAESLNFAIAGLALAGVWLLYSSSHTQYVIQDRPRSATS